MILGYIFFIVLFLSLAGFFSGAETAFVSVNFLKLLYLIEKRNKHALIVHNLLKKPDRLLATTLIGTNLSIVISSALSTSLFFHITERYAVIVSSILISFLVLIYSEILPKTIFRYKANRLILKVAPSLLFFERIFLIPLKVIGFIVESLTNLIGSKEFKKNPFLTKDEIKILIRDVSREGIIKQEEKALIDRIFEFTLTKVADIMIPLKEVVSVNYTDSEELIKEKAKIYGFSRFPVFENKDIKGVINIFDLFYNEGDWRQFIRPLRKVKISERIDKLFSQMQLNKESMAAVIKDKKLIGIVTMEDIIEEIIERL